MSTDRQGTKWRRKIAENFNRRSRVHERYRQTTDGQAIAYSMSSRSLKILMFPETWLIPETSIIFFGQSYRILTLRLWQCNCRFVSRYSTSSWCELLLRSNEVSTSASSVIRPFRRSSCFRCWQMRHSPKAAAPWPAARYSQLPAGWRQEGRIIQPWKPDALPGLQADAGVELVRRYIWLRALAAGRKLGRVYIERIRRAV